jgi:hypothetical protein
MDFYLPRPRSLAEISYDSTVELYNSLKEQPDLDMITFQPIERNTFIVSFCSLISFPKNISNEIIAGLLITNYKCRDKHTINIELLDESNKIISVESIGYRTKCTICTICETDDMIYRKIIIPISNEIKRIYNCRNNTNVYQIIFMSTGNAGNNILSLMPRDVIEGVISPYLKNETNFGNVPVYGSICVEDWVMLGEY